MKSNLHPFFAYFGSKWRTIDAYPPPRHNTIVEPFAGGAGYSVHYASRKVILCDLSPSVVGVWKYLIASSPAEIMALPLVKRHQPIDDLPICQEAKWLIGLCASSSCDHPRAQLDNWSRWNARMRRRIAMQLEAIRHWEVHLCDYREVPWSRPATWFIDPPYQLVEARYHVGRERIDFDALGEWCMSRPGQVIVCEAAGAQWLPFRKATRAQTKVHGFSRELRWDGGVEWEMTGDYE